MPRPNLYSSFFSQSFVVCSDPQSYLTGVETSPIHCTEFYGLSSDQDKGVREPCMRRTSSACSDLSRYLQSCSANNKSKWWIGPKRRFSTLSYSDEDDASYHKHSRNERSLSADALFCQETLATPQLTLDERDQSTFPCLTSPLAEDLRSWLPARVAVADKWSLLYSLDQHGCSLSTLYNRIHDKGPCLLVLQNTEDETFGAYLSEPFKVNSKYYGSGECFLWRTDSSNKLHVYPWTMANDYLLYSDQDILAVGGSNGKFGLCLHANLTDGHSQPCLTFNNPALTQDPSFECVGIEFWGFKF
ncbi:hypothetical protein PHYBLDRAFT_78272 [Phycomyces blakesleeanus NRRL 1555(-)]|uniref:Oxidation resistance protein 1 n=2 Tax=Phycomyces blakesleeanus TaxID=4837 RepID=A0A162ZXT4_PHYB8|nr:hypothetical protein PHYBLDRAFT_78272 [Phycomyces blakesleeanus NRRL 1555(-)]OAD69711.1 hypothetical protein PHYBLDRAFT_78272 [Phycomyces blakesleeanus NRRL 1555(-)]|eukprot:XP_018287751.1 hypothetical protein PHYBLDRAFT_78272 [Phycomyces blakesleeanus NRRL 1555(-)]